MPKRKKNCFKFKVAYYSFHELQKPNIQIFWKTFQNIFSFFVYCCLNRDFMYGRYCVLEKLAHSHLFRVIMMKNKVTILDTMKLCVVDKNIFFGYLTPVVKNCCVSDF